MKNHIIFSLAVITLFSAFSILVVSHELSHMILHQDSKGVCFGTEKIGYVMGVHASQQEEGFIWFFTSLITAFYLYFCVEALKEWRKND